MGSRVMLRRWLQHGCEIVLPILSWESFLFVPQDMNSLIVEVRKCLTCDQSWKLWLLQEGGNICKLIDETLGIEKWSFPGSPVVKTLSFQCKGYGFDPWLGNEDSMCQGLWPKFFVKDYKLKNAKCIDCQNRIIGENVPKLLTSTRRRNIQCGRLPSLLGL